jgi:hypothetical protein
MLASWLLRRRVLGIRYALTCGFSSKVAAPSWTEAFGKRLEKEVYGNIKVNNVEDLDSLIDKGLYGDNELDEKRTMDHIRSESARFRHKLLTRSKTLLNAQAAEKELLEAMAMIKYAVDSASNELPGAKSTPIATSKEANHQRACLQLVFAELEEGLLERGVEARLLVLAALLGEHLLFVGPPGTAKSALCRRLSKLCKGQYFERLLTRFSRSLR